MRSLVVALSDDVRRVTFPLPTPPGHVHAYLLRAVDGWTLVDTGLGLPDAGERVAAAAAELDAPVVRIAITHFHPDHVGGADPAAAATGAAVHQGWLDYRQCELVWGDAEWPSRIAEWFVLHGVPEDVTADLIERRDAYASLIRFARDPALLGEGDELAGWRVLELPGHADGHLCLHREGVLVSGDHLLPGISPAVGLYPGGNPDPLGDYLGSLRRTIELAPRLAYPGHGEPIADPVGRARELLAHHAARLDVAAAALADEPRTAHELSHALFGPALPAPVRRFAVAETLSHLERARREERAERLDEGGVVTWRRPRPASRASGAGGAPGYTRQHLDDELPPSTRAPESGA